MSFMRGKFYVYQSATHVHILVGRDHTEETIAEEKANLSEYSLSSEMLERMVAGLEPDPVHLRTGNLEPQAIMLPPEVFYTLVMRAYDQLTDEERDRFRGDTQWEKAWAEKFGGGSDG